MEIEIIDRIFAVCKVTDFSEVDLAGEFIFIGITDQESSLVCPHEKIPTNTTECDRDWKAFRIRGQLDFSLIGILSKISTLLAENGIGIFAISTYNTDYILTKTVQFDRAVAVLAEAGYRVVRQGHGL